MKKSLPKIETYGWTGLIAECDRRRLGVASHIVQCRAIMAARSLSEVKRIAGGGRRGGLFNLCETGNAIEKAAAEQKPYAVLIAPLDGPKRHCFIEPESDVY